MAALVTVTLYTVIVVTVQSVNMTNSTRDHNMTKSMNMILEVTH